ncbi:MAG: hypothetical protein LJF15_18920 [Acidobacteria bacterium]|jgi:hypothetical protein|nr:hypothetical protein [Acidobacteriota bacterium]
MPRHVLLLSLILSLAVVTEAFATPPDGTGPVETAGGFALAGGGLGEAVLVPDLHLHSPFGDAAELVAPSLVATVEPATPSLSASLWALRTGRGSVPQSAPAPRPMAFEYSDGYYKRLKIHKYASYATLPLFVAQYAVGQKLYDGDGSDGLRSAHTALAVGTGALFGVNTVTGVWNLLEARKDPHKSTKRTVHSILMLVADAGFVATGLTAPESEHENEFGFEQESGGASASTHRAIALTSMGIATVAYLIMLIH